MLAGHGAWNQRLTGMPARSSVQNRARESVIGNGTVSGASGIAASRAGGVCWTLRRAVVSLRAVGPSGRVDHSHQRLRAGLTSPSVAKRMLIPPGVARPSGSAAKKRNWIALTPS